MNHAVICFSLGILLFTFETSSLHAQSRGIKFERLGLEQGLSQQSVIRILQDHQGFMWFGTPDGLNKYDGNGFVIYKTDVSDSTSLSSSGIGPLYEDHTGTLWIGTGNGLNRFDRDKEQFTRFVHDPNDPYSLSNNVILPIYEDRSGTLWIATAGGLNRFNRDKAQFTRFVHDPNNLHSLSHDFIRLIYEDHSGTLWVGTDRGLNRFDPKREQFARYLYDPKDSNSLHGYSVFSIYEDRSGTLWIGTGRWLNKFDREKEQFAHYPQDPQAFGGPIMAILEDRAGTLWCRLGGAGLKTFDRKKEQFTHYLHDPQNPHSLSSDTVNTIYEDRSGTLWFGTGRGLNKFDRDPDSPSKESTGKAGQFTRFVHDPKNPHSLSDNRVLSIYEDRSGILWVGVNGGVNKFDRVQERFTSFMRDPDNPHGLRSGGIFGIHEDRSGTLWIGSEGNGLARMSRDDRDANQFNYFVHNPKNPNSLSHNYVRSIHEDRSGTLWIGMWNGGLNRFDRDTKQFTHFLNDANNPHSLGGNTVLSIYEDRAGTLWFGTMEGGLCRMNQVEREKKQFTRFVHDPQNPHSLSQNAVRAISGDSASQSILWIGTSGGLNRFDCDTERFTRFVHDPKNSHSLSSDGVYSVIVDHTGTVWAGTWGGGFNRLDREKEQFTRYTEKDGLANNVVNAILEDKQGRLWLSTNRGLSRFDPTTQIFCNYDLADGLPSTEFNVPSSYKSQRGEMFLGSVKGLLAFYPDSIKDNPYIPPVVFTAFKRYNTDDAAGKPIIEKGISARKHVTLSYRDNVLAFEFAALSYHNSFKNQYAYKLEGFNDNWIQLGAKHDVTFTNLDPGEYTLRVKGSNNDGVWNEEGASLKISIMPPWWQTRWAYAAYFVLFAAALYGWRRFDLNRAKLRNELKMKNFEAQKLQEMDHMKSRFFANISHEFRTPLTLILGPVAQMRSKEFKSNFDEAYDMILRNGRRLLRLINQLLDLARLEAGSMSLQARPENIVSFLKGLVLSFVSAAERKRIALSISAEEENLIVYFDRDKLEKIVSNLLSNALKFSGEGGKVEVVVSSPQNNTPLNPPSRGDLSNVASSQRDHNTIPPLRGARGVFSRLVQISVSDTGPGIPNGQLDKIFDRFYQIDASHTREHEGTGIGLALTKELVELHHGEIVVQSEVGQGTTFIVRLPFGKEHLRPEEIADSDQLSVISEQFVRVEDRGLKIEDQVSSIEKPGSSIQQRATSDQQQADETIVLVVEDNADVRTYIRQYLEPEFKVIEAVDGLDGVKQALELIPDLIITDVMMPKRDGNELCRMLKTDEKTSHVPIIMLTAKADSESKVQGLETGADDYLIKPFESKELLARVHNLISQRRQLRERFSREIVLKPQDIAITSRDEVFLNKVKASIERHMSDENFEVESLSHEVGMSRVHLHRKLKALTNQSASQFLRSLRLLRAVELLRQNAGTVAEIAYEVGFGSQAYFTKCFHEQFGCAPKEYVKKSTPTQEA
ncbi:MAG: Sensor histidine kinase RcsC [bacterium]|nr:Sensor histidine kinase RcsC [bacterium]